mmetsp:Transcript_8772/g.16667  ORF Transcript_8772/g.16667 Transcript_8772/m.16667 type:complete len:331 (+) Transcript_8772:44-1036(+)
MSRLAATVRQGSKEPVAITEAALTNGSVPCSLDDLLLETHGRLPQDCQVHFAFGTERNWGGRHENEDRWAAHSDTEGNVPFHVLAVMDGHDSEAASDTVGRRLPGILSKQLRDGITVEEAYTQTMAELEDELKEVHATAGTCVVSCLVAGRFIWCANLGDCRAAIVPLQPLRANSVPILDGLCWMSCDHKASDCAERQRIEEAGGRVIDGRVDGLEPSRSLGDFDVKQQTAEGVISIVPDVRRYELGDGSGPAQAILICATDGVWDVVSGKDICDLIQAHKDLAELQQGGIDASADCQPLKDLADDLVKFSIARGSRDDCTAVVAFVSVA